MVNKKLKTKYLSNLRKGWVKEKWAKHRLDITMTDLAEIFGVSVVTIYKIIKKVD